MPGVVRKVVDAAGGPLAAGSDNVFVNGSSAVRWGDLVSNHGLSPHATPTMAGYSPDVFVNNLGVCRQGDAASCTCTATGSPDVFANG